MKKTTRPVRAKIEILEKLAEPQPPAEKQSAREAARRERERADLVERRIQEAMANGEFDNLRGKGKPFVFNTNPYLDPAQELAFGLLQHNNLAPEWIERDKEIRQEMKTIRTRLKRAWLDYQAHPGQEAAWQAEVGRFEESLKKLNRKIDDFNLVVPFVSGQRFRLRLEDELRRAQEPTS
jgi:DnaJ family protein C protein 28